MSMTSGAGSAGTPMAIGFVPSIARRPPQGCTRASLVDIRTAIWPSRAMRPAYQASMPRWLLLRTAAIATPVSFARSANATRAAFATTGPSPCCPSTSRKAAPRHFRVPSVTGSAMPRRTRSITRGRRSSPCEGCPACSAASRSSICCSAWLGGTPTTPRARRAMLRACSIWTGTASPESMARHASCLRALRGQ